MHQRLGLGCLLSVSRLESLFFDYVLFAPCPSSPRKPQPEPQFSCATPRFSSTCISFILSFTFDFPFFFRTCSHSVIIIATFTIHLIAKLSSSPIPSFLLSLLPMHSASSSNFSPAIRVPGFLYHQGRHGRSSVLVWSPNTLIMITIRLKRHPVYPRPEAEMVTPFQKQSLILSTNTPFQPNLWNEWYHFMQNVWLKWVFAFSLHPNFFILYSP